MWACSMGHAHAVEMALQYKKDARLDVQDKVGT